MSVKNFLSSFDYQYAQAPRDVGGPRSERGELLDRVRIAGEHTCYGYFQGFAVYLMTRSTEKTI
jgi:hypothetical protein